MSNKFKTAKGAKLVGTDEQLSLEELEAGLVKMTEDRFKKMDLTYDMIDNKFDALIKRYHGMAGLLDVFDAYKRLDDCAMITDAIAIAKDMAIKVEAMQIEWGTMQMACKADFEACKDELNGWLDQFLDPEFVDTLLTNIDADYSTKVKLACTELLTMSVCQELWELIRRLIEFWTESGKQISDVVCKIKELKGAE